MQNNLSYVDLATCKQYQNPTTPFILVLEKGDNLFASLIQCATAMNLKSASVSGLGALENVGVAFYDLNKQQYQTKLFVGHFELISLNGNISTVEDEPFVHIHASLGLHDYSVAGGHITEASVGATAELTIIPFPTKIYRQLKPPIGLKLMCGWQPK